MFRRQPNMTDAAHGTARSVAWCSASIWTAPDGSGQLTSEASSVWSDPEEICRIVWVINLAAARICSGFG